MRFPALRRALCAAITLIALALPASANATFYGIWDNFKEATVSERTDDDWDTVGERIAKIDAAGLNLTVNYATKSMTEDELDDWLNWHTYYGPWTLMMLPHPDANNICDAPNGDGGMDCSDEIQDQVIPYVDYVKNHSKVVGFMMPEEAPYPCCGSYSIYYGWWFAQLFDAVNDATTEPVVYVARPVTNKLDAFDDYSDAAGIDHYPTCLPYTSYPDDNDTVSATATWAENMETTWGREFIYVGQTFSWSIESRSGWNPDIPDNLCYPTATDILDQRTDAMSGANPDPDYLVWFCLHCITDTDTEGGANPYDDKGPDGLNDTADDGPLNWVPDSFGGADTYWNSIDQDLAP